MKRIFERFFITCAALFICSNAWAEPITIVVFGDSLTSGYQIQPEAAYPAQLQARLKQIGFDNFQVLNMSVPGETTSGALERVSSVLSKQPSIVIVELGANDVLQGINISVISNNIARIIGMLQQEHVYVILFGTKAPSNLGYSYASQLEATYRQLAAYYKIPLYPFILDGVWGNPELNLADGFHPNGRGVGVMVENTYRLADAALRWKYEAMQQEQYQRQEQQYQQQQEAAPAFGNQLPVFDSTQIVRPQGNAPRPGGD